MYDPTDFGICYYITRSSGEGEARWRRGLIDLASKTSDQLLKHMIYEDKDSCTVPRHDLTEILRRVEHVLGPANPIRERLVRAIFDYAIRKQGFFEPGSTEPWFENLLKLAGQEVGLMSVRNGPKFWYKTKSQAEN